MKRNRQCTLVLDNSVKCHIGIQNSIVEHSMQDWTKKFSKNLNDRYCITYVPSNRCLITVFYSTDSKSRVFQMLGLVGYLKGITSDIVTSECVLMSYANGGILLLNTTDTQQFTQLTAHFIGNVDEERACNFAAFMPFEETTPLRVTSWLYIDTWS